MGYLLTGLLMIGFVLLFAFAFVKASPTAIASTLRMLGPLLSVLVGLGLTAVGRFGYGVPLTLVGLLWWYHNRKRARAARRGPTSVFRGAWLEITVDQMNGTLDGLVLTGSQEGQMLSDMSDDGLIRLYNDLSGDPESAFLMESYLDSQVSGWREHPDAGPGPGQGSTSGTGSMTQQEAYQILGLEQGASAQEIRSCYDRLIRIIDAQSTGAELLATRVDEAKDTLLDS